MNEDDYSPSKAILLFKHRTDLKFILKSQLLWQAVWCDLYTEFLKKANIMQSRGLIFSLEKYTQYALHNIMGSRAREGRTSQTYPLGWGANKACMDSFPWPLLPSVPGGWVRSSPGQSVSKDAQVFPIQVPYGFPRAILSLMSFYILYFVLL